MPKRHVGGAQRHVHAELGRDQRDRLAASGVGVRVSAPTGMASGSITMSSHRDLVLLRGDVDELADQLEAPRPAPRGSPPRRSAARSRRRRTSSTIGRIASSRSSSAGHRVDQRLALVGGQPGVEHLDDRGVDDQRQVGQLLDQRGRPARISSASSASGAPMLTSSSMAPPATCSSTSISTRDRSPCAQLLLEDLPAGRVDPLADDRRTAGRHRSAPSLVAEDRMVCTGSSRHPVAVRLAYASLTSDVDWRAALAR